MNEEIEILIKKPISKLGNLVGKTIGERIGSHYCYKRFFTYPS